MARPPDPLNPTTGEYVEYTGIDVICLDSHPAGRDQSIQRLEPDWLPLRALTNRRISEDTDGSSWVEQVIECDYIFLFVAITQPLPPITASLFPLNLSFFF